jgi:hypothetical protein
LPWIALDADLVSGIATDALRATIIWRLLDASRYPMLGSYECISTCHDILPQNIKAFADVEHLVGRTDLNPSDVIWEPFHTQS